MPRMTAAEAAVKILESEGVEYIFGIPGANINSFYAALSHSKKIKHLISRHEEGASHAADGYARASGKVGICACTSGPAPPTSSPASTPPRPTRSRSSPLPASISAPSRARRASRPSTSTRSPSPSARRPTTFARRLRSLGLPRGVPNRPGGPAWPGPHRLAARRPARRDRVSTPRSTGRSPSTSRSQTRGRSPEPSRCSSPRRSRSS